MAGYNEKGTWITTRDEIEAIYQAIVSPSYSHSRAGRGLWSETVYIYRRDKTSPSGVMLAASGNSNIVDPMLRILQNNSALSPSERY